MNNIAPFFMGKHEEKICPRCQTAFECKVGDVLHCQCYGIALPDGVSQWIGKKYGDCLCAACLQYLSVHLPETESPKYT